jgi:prepilin peptidase CpaA
MSLEMCIALAIGIAASGEDLWRRNVSNWIPVAALIGALVAQTLRSGWWGLAYWAGGAAIGFGVFLVFYLLGGMGGGDVKLMAGFGAILGPSRLLEAVLATAILGGILALAVVLWRWANEKLVKQWFSSQSADKPSEGAASPERVYIPYAPAISLGAWIALMPKVGP